MSGFDFSAVASRYEQTSTVQKSAAEVLLQLMQIGEGDDVLDLGCGTGHITRTIREVTSGRVVGADPSPGMISEAEKGSKVGDVIFIVRPAEELDFREEFDVVFCNSAFQWFRDPRRALKSCQSALRPGGRIGIQAPARRIYSPTFIAAIEWVREDPRTCGTFCRFQPPWLFLEKEEEYEELFQEAGFKVLFSRIETVRERRTPEEVFRVFASGAIAGYLNPAYYEGGFDEAYAGAFQDVVRDAFVRMAEEDGSLELIFHRIYLVARS
ncbi:MAG: methyltransferase domain-containing protein [Geobacter sp.]|nr:methyltransferase domain-containing protein [Geobacter sp.]